VVVFPVDTKLLRGLESLQCHSPNSILLSVLPPLNTCDFCHQPGHSRLDCEAISIAQKTMKRRRRQRKRQNKCTKQLDIHFVTEFAGHAALSDYMALNSLLQLDAKFNWIADTGATSHMTPHRHWIHNYAPLTVPVRLADNTIVYSAGVGTVVFNPVLNGKAVRPVEFT
jgi:hypothetical protein